MKIAIFIVRLYHITLGDNWENVIVKNGVVFYNGVMVKTGRVMTWVSATAIAVVGLSIIVGACTNDRVGATESGLTMAATIEPSMTVTISDANKKLNIVPSSTGTFGSTSVTVGAYSNGSVGYTLAMQLSNTALVGDTSSIPTLASNSSCAGGSACTSSNFAVGRWGIAIGNETYRAATSTRNLVTVANTSNSIQNNTYTVNLGANLDLSTPIDNYSTTIDFIATPSIKAYRVIIAYDSGISGVQVHSGNFILFPESGDASSKTYSLLAGHNYTIDISYAAGMQLDEAVLNGSGFFNSDTGAFTVGTSDSTLALTSTAAQKVYMQNIAAAEIDNLLLAVGYDPIVLFDNRDEKGYMVAKLEDGNYWMLQNLDHDIVDTANFYTYSNTDIGHGASPNANAVWTGVATYPTDDSTWIDSNTDPESYDPGNWCWDGHSGDPVNCSQSGEVYHIGNYYNWTAAVAMDNSSQVISYTDVDRSICPAGWMLPKNGTGTGVKSFENLITSYEWSYDPVDMSWTGNFPLLSAPIYLNPSGDWYGYQEDFGSATSLWTSYNYDAAAAMAFSFSGTNNEAWSFDDGIERTVGFPVRCVLRNN